MTVQRLKLAGVAIACFAFLAAAPGVAFAQSKCTGGELKAASKKSGGKTKCWAKATGKGLAVDSACLSTASTKFSTAYGKATGKGDCTNGTTASTIETKVDDFITDLVTEVNGGTGTPTASKCSSKEIGAAGKKAGGFLKCYSKAASKGLPLDTACTGKAQTKFGAAWTKATAAGDCLTTVDQGTIETKVDNFASDVNGELTAGGSTTTTTPGGSTTTTIAGCAPIVVGQPIANTYKLQGTTGGKVCTTNAAANRFGTCTTDTQCGGTSGACLQLPWVTADGQVMPFPTGTQTTFKVAAAGAFPGCEHSLCIPCGNPNAACAGIPGCEVAGNPNGCIPRGTLGCCDTPAFIVPVFFVDILGGLCSRVDQIDCGVGVINTSNPQTGDNEVTKNGDTSDPGADCCYNGHPGSECIGGVNMTDDPAPLACTVAQAGNDYKGKITRTLGNGSADANGIQYRLTTPELSTTWSDGQSPAGTCAPGSKYDDGELLVSQLILKAEPSTAGATGSFTDQNGDGCKRAGQGFINAANAATDGPITVSGAPTGPASPQPFTGSAGSVAAAVSEVFSGPNSPIKDIGFVAITPNTRAVVASPVTCSCTPTPSCPE